MGGTGLSRRAAPSLFETPCLTFPQGEGLDFPSMRTFLKTALVWLVMLAVPAQGFAAAAMLECGPLHERAAAGASAHDHGAGHDHADGYDQAAGHSHAEGGVPADASAVAGDASGSKCSACATCCVGAALLAFLPDLAVPPAASERFVPTFEPVTGFVTGGPKRPPRSSRA